MNIISINKWFIEIYWNFQILAKNIFGAKPTYKPIILWIYTGFQISPAK